MRRYRRRKLVGRVEFRTVFKVHGVIVTPAAAPNEAVALKRIDDLTRHTITVLYGTPYDRIATASSRSS